MNSMGDDQVAVFLDAMHPTHAARPVGCWAPKKQKLAIEQTSGRDCINIHGAIDLESGQTRMIEAESIDAKSTIRLLEALEALYPFMVCIQVFLDNASYHHAKLVKEWLSGPGRRIKLHFLPPFCPHLMKTPVDMGFCVLGAALKFGIMSDVGIRQETTSSVGRAFVRGLSGLRERSWRIR
jgi:hypothetical protein